VNKIVSTFLLSTCAFIFGAPDDIVGGWPDFEKPEQIRNETFIITPAHSGSHYLRFTLVKFTEHPICYLSAKASDPLQNKLTAGARHLKCDLTKRPYFWGHGIGPISNVNSQNNKLLMSFRNFKEKLSRDCVATYKHLLGKDKSVDHLDFIGYLESQIYGERHGFQQVIERLKLFEKWDPNNKLLVYYENLVDRPESSFREILSFLNKDPSLVDMTDFEAHKNAILDFYNEKRNLGSITRGKDPLFYSKKMDLSRLKKIDAYLEKTYPVLWEKYFSRYASKKEELCAK